MVKLRGSRALSSARWLLPVSALMAWACAQPRVAQPARPATDWTAITVEHPLLLSEWVVLRETALLRERPADDAPSMVAAAPSAASAPASGVTAAGLYVYRYAGQRGDWVAVDSLLYHGPHCYSALDPLRGMRLRFYVRSAELVRVMARTETVRFPDGTAVGLRTGTALANDPSRPDGYVAALDDLQVPVHLTPDAIGFRYGLLERDRPRPDDKIADTTVGRLTIRPGLLRNADGAIVLARDDASLDVMVARGSERGTARVRYTTDACGNYFTVDVPASAVRPPSGLITLFDGIRMALPGPHDFGIRAGAPAYWPSGWRAGTVVEKSTVGAEVEGQPGRRCFELWLVGARTRADLDRRQVPSLCVAPADVTFDRTKDDDHAYEKWRTLP